MKKYLITKTQLDLLANLLTDVGIPNDLNSLKPIEPLSEQIADDVAALADRLDSTIHMLKSSLPPSIHITALRELLPDYLSQLRAIERHILGAQNDHINPNNI